jgi:hypothetical protein
MNEHWAVFHEYELWSNFANHPRHVIPHGGTFSIKSCASACNGNVCAWKASRNNVNNSSPRLSDKGLYVIPNRERRKNAVILSGAQYACWVGFPFDCTDCSPSKEFAAKYSSTSACEKSQLIQNSSPTSCQLLAGVFFSVLFHWCFEHLGFSPSELTDQRFGQPWTEHIKRSVSSKESSFC